MAGAKASALRLYQVCAGSESVGRSCAAAVRLVLKCPELIDAGAMDVLKAYEDGVWRCDILAVADLCEIWIFGTLPYRCT